MIKLKELGFTFRGKHSGRDYGLIWIPEGIAMAGSAQRNEYEIGGADVSALLPGVTRKSYQVKGALYAEKDPESYSEAVGLLRRVISWLRGGRGELSFDYDPDVYVMAQADCAFTWTDKTWIDGGLPITFTVQPGEYMKRVSAIEGSTQGTGIDLSVSMEGTAEVPFVLEVENKGTKAVNKLTVTVDGKKWILEDAALVTGETAVLTLIAPVDACVKGGRSLLGCLTRADGLKLKPGPNTVNVTVVYGAAGQTAAEHETEIAVKLTARGEFD